MHTLLIRSVVTAALLLATTGVYAAKAAKAKEAGTGSFEPKACPADYANAKMKCGTVRVPENWAKPAGRKIKLHVQVIPAKVANPLPPLVVLVGGPGSAATDAAPYYVGDGAPFHDNQDVVLFDQRGTGESSPLHCPSMEPPRPSLAVAYDNPYQAEDVRKCRDTLAKQADLAAYNTAAAVSDLEAIRVALGYKQLSLHGMSYGTNYALAYIHAYPDHVRAAFLESVVAPADLFNTQQATAAQRGLDAMLEVCSKQSDCNNRYPKLKAELKTVLGNLAQKPSITAQAGDPPKTAQFQLTGEQFMEELRGLLSVSPLAHLVPRVIHDASTGDYQAFVDLTIAAKTHANNFTRGLYFSMTCSDAYSHLDYDKQLALESATQFGGYKLRIQHDVCAVWPTTAPPDGYFADFKSPVPTLFISGELDPVTPPAWAERLTQSFAKSRQVRVPGMGHVPASDAELKCLSDLEVAFLDTPEPQAMDTSCFEELPFQPFN